MRNRGKAASFWLLAAFALIVCWGGGEDTSKKPSATNKNKAFGDYLTKPFDPTVEKLPPNFIGCDASAIYKVVAATFSLDGWKRGEYEKSDDYAKRINNTLAQLGGKTMIGEIKFSSTLAFALPPVGAIRGSKKDRSVETFYDADNEILTISAGSPIRFSNGALTYYWGVNLQNLGGTPAPGGQFWLISPDDWGIVFAERDGFPKKDIVWRLREVAAEQAQRERNKIGALCVCNLRYDNIAQTTRYSDLGKDWAVRVTEPEFWLYHIETGDVLAKYSWGETERGVAKKIGDLTIEDNIESRRPSWENRDGETASEQSEKFSNKINETSEHKTEETNESVVYATEPFDPSWETLPPNYRGHDPEAIYDAVSELFDESEMKKNEFEKTTDYRKRVDDFWKELQGKTLGDEVKFSSPLAFALVEGETDEGASLQGVYDADKETLTLKIAANLEVKRPDGGFLSSLHGLYFKEGGKRNSGFGSSGKKWGVAFAKGSVRGEFALRDVKQNAAKELAGNVGALCVCNLSWRRGEEGELLPKSCFDGYGGAKAIWVTEPVFWLYNVETGRVLAKFSLDEVKKKTAKPIDATPEERKREALEKAKREAATAAAEAERDRRATSEQIVRGRRKASATYEDGNRRLTTRANAVKKLPPSRRFWAPLQIAVPGDCATLAEALDEAAKKASKDEIPRIVLDAGEYDASGATLKTFVEIQSASGKPEDVVLTVDAASPITVDGETVVSFDGVTLRQVGGGAKSGACVEVKRGIALLFGCVLDGKNGAKFATGVKAVGLKSAVVLYKCVATGFSLSALHVEDGAFGWAVESVFGPKNRFGASSKAARLEAEKCEFRGNETGLYFRGIATGGAQGNVYAENKRDAQILDGAKVEVDAPNVDAGK